MLSNIPIKLPPFASISPVYTWNVKAIDFNCVSRNWITGLRYWLSLKMVGVVKSKGISALERIFTIEW